ncbi:ABC-type bacteriocin transporter [Staphylococcus epidermidis]
MPKIKYIEQPDEKDCGPTCLAMISKYFGKNVSVPQLREYSKTDFQGTNILGLIEAGNHIGLNIEAYELDNIQEMSNHNLPVICHIINESGFEHYVILEKIKNDYVYIVDPAKGKQKLKNSIFYNQWTKIVLFVETSQTFNTKPLVSSVKNFYLNIFKNNQQFIWALILISILINVISILGSFYFQFLVDTIIPSNIIYNLNIISFGILMLYLVSLLSSFIRYQLTLNMGMRISKKLMLDYYEHVLNLPIGFFATRKEGEILSRLRDTDYVRDAFSSVTVSITIDALMVVFGSIILYIQNKYLFLIVVFLIPMYILLAYFFKKPFETYNKEEMEKNADLSSSFIEGIKGIDAIKSYTSEKKYFHKTLHTFDEFLDKVYKLGSYTNIQVSLKEFLKLFTSLVILWFGSSQVMLNKLNLGELLTFNALVVFYFGSIDRLIDTQPVIQSALVSTRRIIDILDLQVEKKSPNSDFLFQNQITFSQVSFQYGFRKEILKDINMKIPKGTSIGIVGESGSGKSTVAKLLLKYYSVNLGDILIDNKNIDDISYKALRKNIGYVPQEPFIFYGTVEENLKLGRDSSISDEDIISACKIAEAHEFITELPQGYETMLESGGNNLSGGQIQRLAIARAILKKPNILLFDEPTSALDSYTENKIIKNLDSLPYTKIIISHKLRLTQSCNNIIVMKDGEIIESGKHNELIKRKSYYYTLWDNQKI